MFALYGDSGFRRELWESAYDGTKIRENESQAKTPLDVIPSLEHRVLANYINDGYSREDDVSEIDKVFAEWPDLVRYLKENVPWSGLAARVWSDAGKKFDTWANLDDAQRRQTALRVFAVATIIDDERVLRAAIRKVPDLEREFGDVLDKGGDSETAADSAEEEDVLLRWNDLCKSLQALAARAAEPTPVVEVLVEITHVVGELEEIEQSVRERLALSSFEHLMSHLDELLGELEADPAFSWLEEGVRAQLHAPWRGQRSLLSSAQMREETDRLKTEVPVAVEHVRKLDVALSDAERRLGIMSMEEPTDFHLRLSWDDEVEGQENQVRALRKDRTQAWIALLSRLSPQGKEFDPSQSYSSSLPVQDSARNTDEPMDSVPVDSGQDH